MTKISKASDLRVFKVSLENLDELYEIAYLIPHLKLRTQLINSGEAIPPLVAEGFARQRNPADAARFYELAMVESDEVMVHLQKAVILSRRFPRIPKERCQALGKHYQELSKQLNSLRQTWRKFADPANPHTQKSAN